MIAISVALIEGTTLPLVSEPDAPAPLFQRSLRLGFTTPIELMLPGHGEAGPLCSSILVLGCVDYPALHPQKLVKRRCMRRECPDCGPHAWAWREAVSAHGRLVAWLREVGWAFLPDHLQNAPTRTLLRHVTLSHDDQREPETKEDLDALYSEAYATLERMGMWGGAAAFHPFRHDGECTWVEGPHFHAIGFGLVNEKDRPPGWVVRDVTHLKPSRGQPRSWMGTLKYVLDHSLVPRAPDHRYHSIRWFGALATCKFTSRDGRDTTTARIDFCIVCHAEMAPIDSLLAPSDLDALDLARWQMAHRPRFRG